MVFTVGRTIALLLTVQLVSVAYAQDTTAPTAPAQLRLKGTPSGSLANLKAIGLNPNEFWVTQPPINKITFRPPAQNNVQGLRIGRLWLPPTLAELRADIDRKYLGVNDDGTPYPGAIAANLANNPYGVHHKALVALLTNNAAQMAEAKAGMLADTPGFVPGAGSEAGAGGLWASLLALDWITWANEAEFEQAFVHTKARVQAFKNQGLDWATTSGGSFFNNDVFFFAGFPAAELLLVAVAHGRPGPSGTWAVERLTHLGEDANVSTALLSPWRAANTLSLLSQNGGGQQAGTGHIQSTVAFGGYESYFGLGGAILLHGWDTATGSNLFSTQLYHRTRAHGFALELDPVVEKRDAIHKTGSAIFEIIAGLLDDGVATWVLDNSPGWNQLGPLQGFMAFRALSGQNAAATPPTTLIGTSSHQWHYQDDKVQLRITTPHIQHARRDPQSRTLGFRFGKVGLVQGHYSRGSVQCSRANGVVITAASSWDNNPGGSGEGTQTSPFGDSNLGAISPEPVASDPRILLTTIRPTLENGKYEWSEDWTYRFEGISPVRGKVQLARTTYSFDTSTRVLTIEDEIEADTDLYVAWHFSPSRMPTINGAQLAFGDGTDSVQVKLEALDGATTFASAVVDTEHTDMHTVLYDRIAANVAFKTSTRLARHHVRVTISPN